MQNVCVTFLYRDPPLEETFHVSDEKHSTLMHTKPICIILSFSLSVGLSESLVFYVLYVHIVYYNIGHTRERSVRRPHIMLFCTSSGYTHEHTYVVHADGGLERLRTFLGMLLSQRRRRMLLCVRHSTLTYDIYIGQMKE